MDHREQFSFDNMNSQTNDRVIKIIFQSLEKYYSQPLNRLEQRFHHIEQRFDHIEQRLEQFVEQFKQFKEHVEIRFARSEQRITNLESARNNQVDQRFRRANSVYTIPNNPNYLPAEQQKTIVSFPNPQQRRFMQANTLNPNISQIREIIRQPISSIRANPIPQPLFTSQQSMYALFPSQQQQKPTQLAKKLLEIMTDIMNPTDLIRNIVGVNLHPGPLQSQIIRAIDNCQQAAKQLATVIK